MPPDCIPGLHRPVSVSEYATLTGVREAEVLAAIRALKIRCAHSNGEWWVEAPPNCEARLAQLRSDKAGTKKEAGLADWVRGLAAEARERTQSDSQPQRQGLRLNELPQPNKSEQQKTAVNADKPAVAAAPNIADARPVNLNSGSPHAKARKNKLT